MSSMALSLIVKLVNQTASGARGVVSTLDTVKKKAAKAGSDFSSAFSKSGAWNTDNFDKTLGKFDSRVNQTKGKLLGAAGMLLTAFEPIRRASNFEDAFVDFANVAQIPVDQMGKVEQQLVAQSKHTGKGKMELLEILAEYVGKGMELEAAMAAVGATGRTATAEGADQKDMASSGYAVMDNLNVAPENLTKAFEAMVASGKEGSFELKNMASKFPEITAGAKALKMQGVDAVASLAAALQVSMKSAGGPDQAANNFANFLGKLTAPDTIKKFKKQGVDIEKVLKDAAKNGGDPLIAVLEKIKETTGGDQFKLGELFADKQVLDFLRAAIPGLEKLKEIKEKSLNSDGVIDEDFANIAGTFSFATGRITRAIDRLLSRGGAFLPLATSMANSIADIIERVAAWTEANPELTAVIMQSAAALLVFGAGARVLSFVYALLARDLFKLLGLFFRFNAAGRNVSIAAKALRGLGWIMRGLNPLRWARLIPKMAAGFWRTVIAPLRWLSILGRFSLSKLVRPLVWTASLIPKIGWMARLGSKFALSKLVRPVVWTAGLIPKIGWTKRAGRLTLSKLVTPLSWTTKLVPKIGWLARLGGKFALSKLVNPLTWTKALIPGIGWAALAGELAWHLIIKPLEWDKYFNLDKLKNGLKIAKDWVASFFGNEGPVTDQQTQAFAFSEDGSDVEAPPPPENPEPSLPHTTEPVYGPSLPQQPSVPMQQPLGQQEQLPSPDDLMAGPIPAPASGGNIGEKLIGDLKGFLATEPVKGEVDARINASVIDKRPPNVTVNAPITINEATNAGAVAAAVRNQLGSAVSKGKAGALHDGVD